MQARPNTLFVADPLDVLRRLDSQQFDLVLLDPPFYGGYLVDLTNPQAPPYHTFDEYLEYIVNIFLQSYRILTQPGSILLRVNPSSPYNSRLFLERIFGKQNFRGEIIWKSQIRSFKAEKPYLNFDSVYFFSKSESYTYNEPIRELTEDDIKNQYSHHDEHGSFKLWNLVDNLDRPERYFEWQGVKPPKGKSWKYSRIKLDELFEAGQIYKSGKFPRRKIYLEAGGLITPLGFVWDESADTKAEKDQIDFRFIKAVQMVSNAGDKVLDVFMNPVTLRTIEQANRFWVGISSIEIVSKEFPQLKSIDVHEMMWDFIQDLDIVDQGIIPERIHRLVEAEARAVNPREIIENSGRRYAFLVGINHYKDSIGDLNYCINDVVELEQTLRNLGYEVKVLHDDAEDDNLIPSRSNIETEFYNLVQGLKPEDTLFIHFSCHGTLIDDQALLVTSDTRAQRLRNTAYSLSDLISLIKDGRVRKKVLTLDVCHAGVELGRAIIDQEFVDNVYNNAEGFVLLAASTAQQQAYESTQYKHGLFTYSLIQGLKGDADFDGDGRITVEDLRNYALNSIRNWNAGNGRRQDPTYRSEGIGEITLVFPE